MVTDSSTPSRQDSVLVETIQMKAARLSLPLDWGSSAAVPTTCQHTSRRDSSVQVSRTEMGCTYSKRERREMDQTLLRVGAMDREKNKRTTKQKVAKRHSKEGGNRRRHTSGAGITEADDRQVTTVFTVQPSLYHRHSTNRVS